MTPMSLIHEKICEHFKVGREYPFQDTVDRHVVYLRQLFHYLSRKLSNTAYSFNEIGKYHKNKRSNYATVLYSCNRIAGFMDVDEKVRNDVEQIIELIKGDEWSSSY